MIVFDKDGTLGDDKAALRRWATQMTTHLTQLVLETFRSGSMPQQQQLLPGLLAEFHTTIGWDPIRQSVLPSAPLAAGTWGELVDTLEDFVE